MTDDKVTADEDEFAAAGVYDPADPGAADRLDLLRHLAARGVTIAEMKTAVADGLLALAGLDRMLTPQDGHTLDEVARRANIEPELVERAQRALGLPPLEGPFYSDTSVAALAAAAAFFGAERTLQFSRVIGASLSRIVDAAMSGFLADFEQLVGETTTDLVTAQRSEAAAELLLDLPNTIRELFPAYVHAAIRRLRMTGSEGAGGVVAAVGFIDLVDSTRLVQRLSGPDLARAVGDFESAAYDEVLAQDGRVVKFIGDATMFICPDAPAACRVGHALCAMVDAHPVLTHARGAIGFGSMIARDGDYYGAVVNLASRLSSVAAPGQVLCTPAVRDAVGVATGLSFSDAGSHVLRGFERPVEALVVTAS